MTTFLALAMLLVTGLFLGGVLHAPLWVAILSGLVLGVAIQWRAVRDLIRAHRFNRARRAVLELERRRRRPRPF